MKKESLFQDHRGVSPVIGTILMVAVVVILAGVVGVTALGQGGSLQESPPQVTFETDQQTTTIYNYDSDDKANFRVIEITHVGGDEIDGENIEVTVNGEEAWGAYRDDSGCTEEKCHRFKKLWGSGQSIQTGDSIVVVSRNHPKIDINKGYLSDEDGPSIWDNEMWAPGASSDADIYLHREDEVRIVWEGSGDRTASLVSTKITA